MLNFEEELKKFQPCLEVEDIEDAVYQEDLADMTDHSERSYGTDEVERLRGCIWSIHRK